VKKVAQINDIQMSVLKWFDNRPVTFVSTFVGAQPLSDE